MIKITNDLREFRERENDNEWIESWINGLYEGNTIWYRYRSKPFSHIVTILHEIGHLIIRKCLSENHATLLFFSEFLEGILDFINGVLRYQEWRVRIHECLQFYVKANFKFWWNWERCKDE